MGGKTNQINAGQSLAVFIVGAFLFRTAGAPFQTEFAERARAAAAGQLDLRALGEWIDARLAPPEEGVYWRGTNRRDEAKDLAAGIEIRSRDHSDGELEIGLSVCETPAYIVMAGYQYGYRVTGRVVGTGSDGEPLLADARPVGKVLTAAAVERVDAPRMRRRRAVMQELADLLAVDYDTISRAYYEI